jgi:hypothetical protein
MPYCLADFKTEGESSKKMLFALSNLISSSNCWKKANYIGIVWIIGKKNYN